MRRRGTRRWALAFVVVTLLAEATLVGVLRVGARGGLPGVVAVLVGAGFSLALIFTVIYDGPRAVRQLMTPRSDR